MNGRMTEFMNECIIAEGKIRKELLHLALAYISYFAKC